MKHKKQLRKVSDDTAVIGSEKPADNTANKSLTTGQSPIPIIYKYNKYIHIMYIYKYISLVMS